MVISEGMTLRDFADKLQVKAKDLIALLVQRGTMANINFVIEPEFGIKLVKEFGLEAKVMTFEQEVQSRSRRSRARARREARARAPVVTIMGHVDHGKTSLLDKIRSSKITEGEFGGITQHIGAYHVDVNNRQIVFLDTPGHEAFTMMRARGARVTDIVVLVVAADDGVMPQTAEAIDHARAAGVPIVVALNKIDKSNANPDRVKQQLADRGLAPEDWGGQTVVVPVSAIKGDGHQRAARDDPAHRRHPGSEGQSGTRRPGHRARGAQGDRPRHHRHRPGPERHAQGRRRLRRRLDLGPRPLDERRSRQAAPTSPARRPPPRSPDSPTCPRPAIPSRSSRDEQKARSIVEFRQQESRKKDLVPTGARLSLQQLFSQIEKGEVKDLAVVLKADVQGSLEVLRDAIEKIGTAKVKTTVLHSGVGAITTNDVLLASASKAIIVGFNIRPERNAVELAEKEQVEIRLYTVIYELLDDLRNAMVGLLEPTFKEVSKGRAEVREIYRVPKVGTIAGCHVLDGVIPRAAPVRLIRDGRVVFEGKIVSLKRFKDDASEVRAGFDCGIGLDRFQDMKPGDIIEAFAKEEIAPTLN